MERQEPIAAPYEAMADLIGVVDGGGNQGVRQKSVVALGNCCLEALPPCYQLAAGSKVQLYYGYENCRFYSRRRLQGGRAPGSQNQKIPQSPF